MKVRVALTGMFLVAVGAAFVWQGVTAEAKVISQAEAVSVRGKMDPMMIIHGPLAQSTPDYKCVQYAAVFSCSVLVAQQNCYGACTGNNNTCKMLRGANCYFCNPAPNDVQYDCVSTLMAACYTVTPTNVFCGPKTAGQACFNFNTNACMGQPKGTSCSRACSDTGVRIDVCQNLQSYCKLQ